MMKGFRYMMMAIAASVTLSVLSSCRDSRVIDEEDMAQIYAEMLMTDQWINSAPDVRRIADTSLVYEPILRKYGYSSEDYRYSIDYYLENDEDFAEIMEQTIRILDARKEVLEDKRTQLENEKKAKEYIKKIAKDLKIDESICFYNNPLQDRRSSSDSLVARWDTLARCFKFKWISPSDSLSVIDSSFTSDTLNPLRFLMPSSPSLKMETLRPVVDTTKTIIKMNEMSPIKTIRPIDGKELKAVTDAYILN